MDKKAVHSQSPWRFVKRRDGRFWFRQKLKGSREEAGRALCVLHTINLAGEGLYSSYLGSPGSPGPELLFAGTHELALSLGIFVVVFSLCRVTFLFSSNLLISWSTGQIQSTVYFYK